jgi:hypothetical protein
MDGVYGSREHVWLSVHGGLVTMGKHGRSKAWEVVVTAQRERERERRSSGFSTVAVSGAPMGRWF